MMVDLPGSFPDSLIHFGKLKWGNEASMLPPNAKSHCITKQSGGFFCRLSFAKMQQHDAQMMQMHVKGPQ